MLPPGDADGLLERLYTMIGARDDAFVADLLRDFLVELPATLTSLTVAFETQDWATLRDAAHRLRSGAHALGGAGIAAASVPLEAAARAAEATSVPILLAALIQEAVAYEQVAVSVLRLVELRIDGGA